MTPADLIDGMVREDMIDIQRTPLSRLAGLDFNNLRFGREFSDHMAIMEYADGAWETMNIRAFDNLSFSPAMSALHYGQSIFEGMKAFKNERGEVNLFRPTDNIARFNQSAERMCMPSVDPELFLEALNKLVALDKGWIPSGNGSSLYIRPFMFGTDEYIGVKPSDTYKFMIFTCPVNAYYTGSVRVKVERHYTRSAAGGTGYAKAAGNYAGALYPAKLAQEQGYDQLVWTDAKEHRWIEESGTMNIVFRSGNEVFSPPMGDTILDGITRESIMQLASDWGYEVTHRPIAVTEIEGLLQRGQLDEAFGAGTAATVAPISTIHIDGTDYDLPALESWKLANRLSADMDAIKRGMLSDPHNWIHRVL